MSRKLISINDNDELIDLFWKNVPKELKKGPYLPTDVPLFTCEMTKPIATDGCQSVAIDKPYKPIYTSNVSISKEQSNKLNTIENNNEHTT